MLEDCRFADSVRRPIPGRSEETCEKQSDLAGSPRQHPPNHIMGKKRVIEKGETGARAEGPVSETVTAAGKQKFRDGRIYIYSSYNNTIMTLTDERGNVVLSVSAGRMGFTGTKKSTPFAASKVAEQLSQGAKLRGVERVALFVKGVGSGRDSAVRSLGAKGLEISSITDLTPIPHNGPRASKVRRV